MSDFESRRRILTTLTASAWGVTMGLHRDAASAADANDSIDRTAEAIRQSIRFKASTARVYAALTDSAQFHRLSLMSLGTMGGDSRPTVISSKPGGEFTLFAGHIAGRQIELAAGQRIVQAWRTVNWEAGWYSIANFELANDGDGTLIDFHHTGFPKGQAEHLAEGWQSHYWQPLAKFLA